MAYLLQSGIHVSIDNVNWKKLTDHNRSDISITPELIETTARMANGKMRKFVVAKKSIVSTTWNYVPSKTSECVDGNYGGAWIESFYNTYCTVPVHVKIISSTAGLDPNTATVPLDFNFKTAETGLTEIKAFMTGFSKTIVNRTQISDYLNLTLEFTEI